MQQTNEIPESAYRERLGKVQETMKEFGLGAIILEPGAAMLYLTGMRWGRSERTFAVVVPAKGELAYIVPGFEEARARELLKVGNDVRIWQEDESPYERIAQVLRDRGVTTGRVGMDETARFFVFDGIRKQAGKVQFLSATPALKKAGVDLTPPVRMR